MPDPPVENEDSGERAVLRSLLIALGLLALLGYVLAVWNDWLPFLRGWSNYPEGWTWALNPSPPIKEVVVCSALAAAIWAAVSLAEISQRREWLAGTASGNRTVKALFLIAAVLIGYFFQLSLLGLKSDNGNLLLVQRVTNRVFTGYFGYAEAALSPDAFFSGYQGVFNTTLCPHCHDHPPGPSLYYWLGLKAVDALPADVQHFLTGWARGALGSSDAAQQFVEGRDDREILGSFVGGTGLLFLASMVVIPLFGLAKLLGRRGYEFRLAAFGLVLPGLMLMSPEFDQAFALVAATSLYLMLRALEAANSGRASVWALAAGVFLGVGVYFSWALGLLVAIFVALVLVCWLGSRTTLFSFEMPSLNLTFGQAAASVGGLLLGVALPLLTTWGLGHVDLAGILQYNLANAARAEAQRPRGVWLFYGPLDFLQFYGLPLTVASVAMLVVNSLQKSRELALLPAQATEQGAETRRPSWFSRVNSYLVLFWLVLFIIDVLGRSKAEQGRLLIFLTPLGLAGIYFATGRRNLSRAWIALLFAAQAVVCIVIGARWIVP